MSAGKKFDQDKAPVVQGCFHYFPDALIAVSFVSKFGAEKYEVPYSDKNFAKVDDATNRYTDAVGRHLLGDAIDGPYDPDSGYLHAAHDAWDALARLQMMLKRDGVDLRDPNYVPKPKASVTPIPTPLMQKTDLQFHSTPAQRAGQWTSEEIAAHPPVPTPLNMIKSAEERFQERIAAYDSDDWARETSGNG